MELPLPNTPWLIGLNHSFPNRVLHQKELSNPSISQIDRLKTFIQIYQKKQKIKIRKNLLAKLQSFYKVVFKVFSTLELIFSMKR